MININGVLYKSSSNKLQKSDGYQVSGSSYERSLFVRGERFILDPSGLKLKRENDNKLKMSRIDIGGLTYKASSDGAFERDNSHQVRSHIRYIRLHWSPTEYLWFLLLQFCKAQKHHRLVQQTQESQRDMSDFPSIGKVHGSQQWALSKEPRPKLHNYLSAILARQLRKCDLSALTWHESCKNACLSFLFGRIV
jgi:hypothetical protein